MNSYSILGRVPLLVGALCLASCAGKGTEAPVIDPSHPAVESPALVLTLTSGTSSVQLASQTRGGTAVAFVDLNANGQRDAGEELSESPKTYSLPAGVTRLALFGDCRTLDLTGQPVEALEGDGLAGLTSLKLSGTKLSGDALARVLGALGRSAGNSPVLQLDEYLLDARLTELLRQGHISAQRGDGTTIDLDAPVLIIRLPKGLDLPAPAYEVEGVGVWLDRNLNGVRDADEAGPASGYLALSENTPEGTVYLFRGEVTSLSVYRPTQEDEEEYEGEEEEAEGSDTASGRALAKALTSEAGIVLDASRAGKLQYVTWEADLKLTVVDASGAEALSSLALSGNPVGALLLPAKSSLRILRLGGHQLTTLDLSQQLQLQEVNLSRGKLTAVTLPAAAGLTTLNLSSNALTTLSLPLLPRLRTLRLEQNQLTSFTLPAGEKYEALETCQLAGNRLTQLDLTPVVKSKLIDVSTNPLTTLTLPRDLKELQVSGTQLVRLDLNPKGEGVRSFLQKLGAANCPALVELSASECTLLTDVDLSGSAALDPERLALSLPLLQGQLGRLRYAGGLPVGARLQLEARGWSVLP